MAASDDDDVPGWAEGVPVVEFVWTWFADRKWIRYALVAIVVLLALGFGIDALVGPDNQVLIVFSVVFVIYAILIAVVGGGVMLVSMLLEAFDSLRGDGRSRWLG